MIGFYSVFRAIPRNSYCCVIRALLLQFLIKLFRSGSKRWQVARVRLLEEFQNDCIQGERKALLAFNVPRAIERLLLLLFFLFRFNFDVQAIFCTNS